MTQSVLAAQATLTAPVPTIMMLSAQVCTEWLCKNMCTSGTGARGCRLAYISPRQRRLHAMAYNLSAFCHQSDFLLLKKHFKKTRLASEVMDEILTCPESFSAFPYEPYPVQKGFQQSLFAAVEAGGVALLESPTGLYVI